MIDKEERKALIKSLSDVIREYFEKHATNAITEVRNWAAGELASIRDAFDERFRALPQPEKGDPGAPGKDAEPVDLEKLRTAVVDSLKRDELWNVGLTEIVTEQVSREVRALPPAKVGEPGRPGKDADPAELEELRRSIDDLKRQHAAEVAELKRQIGALPKEPIRPEPIDLKAIELRILEKIEPRLPTIEKLRNLCEAMREELRTGILASIEIPIPKDGAPGKDADIGPLRNELIEDIAARFNGITEKIVKEIKFQVEQLPRAKDGEPGLPGKDGVSIHPDTVRLMVLEELKKEIAAIPRPQDGKPGADGRDALALEPLPGLDLSKSYPRGTYARYGGGIIRSTGNTLPIDKLAEGERFEKAGWEVAVEGFDGIIATQSEDLRTIRLECVRTSGVDLIGEFSMPVVLDRGVFKAGSEYFRGDGVTQQGSFWICLAERTTTSPATPNNRDWRLAVKCGRDGKDLTPKEPVKAGPVSLA